jgi:hypothetical protein
VATRPPLRARIGTGAAALVPAAALTAAAARGAGNWTWPIAGVALAGLAVAVVALVLGRASLVGPALVLLAVGYGMRLAGLDPGLVGERAAFAVFEGLGAAVVAAVVLAAAGLPAAGGAAGDAVGVIAAAVALGLVAFLSQRLRGHARR